MIALHINIDHVATVRQARQISEPDPVTAAGLVELAGADGITIHLREDRRHIIDRDVRILRQTVQTKLNLEMAHQQKLQVNAGHGLNYINTQRICGLPHLRELNIGHSIVSRAIFVGISQAVREMKEIIILNS